MATPAPDEKISKVMVYTQNMLVHGDVVTRESVRVSMWLRTDAAPRFIHVFQPQLLIFGGSPVKSMSYKEFFIPIGSVMAFHLAPPAREPMDYDEGEANRVMELVYAEVGTFTFHGRLRVSAQSRMTGSLELARMPWMSMYDVEITNHFLPQMAPISVPMLIMNPALVSYGM